VSVLGYYLTATVISGRTGFGLKNGDQVLAPVELRKRIISAARNVITLNENI
jgi:hypothetical protein